MDRKQMWEALGAELRELNPELYRQVEETMIQIVDGARKAYPSAKVRQAIADWRDAGCTRH